MQALIVKWLWVTGIGAAIVLAVPSLVIIGLMALIVPGLILAALPSAFLYGAVFALGWFPLHRAIGDWPAAAVAAAFTLALFWWLPIAGNAVTGARYRAERAEDFLPTAPIVLRGDVRLETRTLWTEQQRSQRRTDGPPPDYEKARCSALCAALLFTDGVTSVTVQDESTDARGMRPVSPRAVTFRLVPRERCTRSIEPLFIHDAFGSGPLRPLEDGWKLRLSTSDCIVAGPPVADADLVVAASRFTTPIPASTRSSHWALGPRPVGVDRLELFDRTGRVLLRHTVARARRLVQPLLIAPEGSMENYHFTFAGKPFGPKYESLDAAALIAKHTTLDVREDDDDLADRVRRRLAELLDDPAAPATDPGFGLVERFLTAMAADGAPPGDVALLVRLIGDARVTNFQGVWKLSKPLGARLEQLRRPIVARLRRADAARERSLRVLGDLLGAMPPGAFAELRPDEAALMDELDRHEFAHALLGRQADRGRAAVPLLTRLLDAQVRLLAALTADRKSRADDPRRTSARAGIDGVRVALCRLGPEASGALSTIEVLEREQLFTRFAGEREWQLTLARLGRPVEAIPKPPNLSGTTERFHAQLRRRLERFDPERDCRG